MEKKRDNPERETLNHWSWIFRENCLPEGIIDILVREVVPPQSVISATYCVVVFGVTEIESPKPIGLALPAWYHAIPLGRKRVLSFVVVH